MESSRRGILAGVLAASVLRVAGARAAGVEAEAGADTGVGPGLELTPSCAERGTATPSQTEGPFFTPEAPARRDLTGDVTVGEPLLLAGLVLDRDCRPLAGARVQIWHADDAGRYDNEGFRLRGHQVTDEAGRWWFSTIVPGLYPGRTRHYHMKVNRMEPGGAAGRVLTTQLYLPGEPGNNRDWGFDERLLLELAGHGDDRVGRFDFVV